MHRLASLVALLALAGCPSSSGSDGGSDAGSPCPADPPSDGTSCPSSGQTCHWLRCAADGQVTATCGASGWDVSSAPCPVTCGGASCGAGQICAILQGGAQSFQCVDDPCAGGPLEACLCGACPSAEPDRCARGAFTVTCNTCFAEICP